MSKSTNRPSKSINLELEWLPLSGIGGQEKKCLAWVRPKSAKSDISRIFFCTPGGGGCSLLDVCLT